MAIAKKTYGAADGKAVDLYTLWNARGMVVKVSTYGAIVTALEARDRDGTLADVVLGRVRWGVGGAQIGARALGLPDIEREGERSLPYVSGRSD